MEMDVTPGAGFDEHVRATLHELARRRRLVTETIVRLSAFVGLSPSDYLDDDSAAPVVSPAPELKRPATKHEPKRVAKTAKAKTARPTEAPSETQEAILAALQAAGEPVSPGEVAKALRLDPAGMRYHLKPLIASGQVKAEGNTTQRRLSLP